MLRFLYLLFAPALLLVQCQSPQQAAAVQFDPEKVPYPLLSSYAFFTGELRALQPNARVMPYEVITPLFSDYAHKARFVCGDVGNQRLCVPAVTQIARCDGGQLPLDACPILAALDTSAPRRHATRKAKAP